MIMKSNKSPLVDVCVESVTLITHIFTPEKGLSLILNLGLTPWSRRQENHPRYRVPEKPTIV